VIESDVLNKQYIVKYHIWKTPWRSVTRFLCAAIVLERAKSLVSMNYAQKYHILEYRCRIIEIFMISLNSKRNDIILLSVPSNSHTYIILLSVPSNSHTIIRKLQNNVATNHKDP
jgi:hypothetical protein